MAKTYLKVLKDNCSRLKKSLSLEAFVVGLKSHDGSILLSVVAQALLLTVVCRSLPSPSSSDVDDGC
jgi:hypothetical protein